MIEDIVDLLRSAHIEGLQGDVILGCLALYLPAWAVLVWRGAGAGARVAAAFVALFGLGAIGGGLAFVSASRAGLRQAVGLGAPGSPEPGWGRAMEAWMAVERGEMGLLILSMALLVTALFGLALVARKALSSAPPGPGASTLAASASIAAGALSLVLLDRTLRMLPQRAMRTVSVDVLGAMVDGSLEAQRASRPVLVAAMILAAALAGLLWWRRARGEAPRGRRVALIGAVLLVAGVAAMAATRAHAADAASPIPSRRLPTEWLFDEGDATEDLGFLPEATRCERLVPDRSGMPEIYSPPVVRIDGPTATFREDTFLDEASLVRKLAERHERAFGPSARELPPWVKVRVGRGVRPADLARWFRALHDLLNARILVQAIDRRSPWPSRTLGEIPGGGWYCSLRWTWGAGDHVMSAYPAFEDVVAEMERSPEARWAP